MRRRLVIDCDPGLDDAIALFLAFASRELEVVGVTTVAGNVCLDKATGNALRVLGLIGVPADVPVVPGHSGPVARAERHPDEPIHGDGGLGGIPLPAPTRSPLQMHAVDWMAEQLTILPGQVTIAAIGPLTNVAGLLHRHPGSRSAIAEVVIMGGAAFTPGNVTAAAEFNLHADPEAARFVAESGVPLRFVPLDVTRLAALSIEDVATVRSLGGVAATAADMLAHLVAGYARSHHVQACAVHDVVTIAAITHPELFTWTSAWVTVECGGEFTRGSLVVDVRDSVRDKRNAAVATGIDAAGFRRLLLSRIAAHGSTRALDGVTGRPQR